MSNAMRSGKRWLAGVAAGALGVGALAISTVPSASATDPVAASFSLTYPSYTIVVDSLGDGTIKAPVEISDAAGDEITGTTLGAGRALRVSIANPAAVGGTANTWVEPSATNTATYSAATGLTFRAKDGVGGNAAWSTLATVGTTGVLGTYTMSVALINTNTGAVLQSATVPILVTDRAGAPAPTVNFLNNNGATPNVINALGVGTSTTASADQDLYLTNSTGGPWIAAATNVTNPATDDTTGVGIKISARDDSPFWTLTTSNITSQSLAPGMYDSDASSPAGSWASSAGRNTVTATVWVASAQLANGTLPVSVGNLKSGTFANLTTTPQAVVTAGSAWQVPAGTSELSFTVDYSSAIAGSIPWNVVSNSAAGATSASGGTITTNAAGIATLTFRVNAAASANGKILTVTIGSTSYTVTFASAAAALDVVTPLAQVSTASAIPGTITNQFGGELAGSWVITLQPSAAACFNAATVIGAGITAAQDGTFSLPVPAAAAPSTPQTATFGVCATNGVSRATKTASVIYTASGQVSALDLVSTVPNIPVLMTPFDGYVNPSTDNDTQNNVVSAADADVNAQGCGLYVNYYQESYCSTPVFHVNVSSTPVTAVTLTVPEGVYLTTRQSGTIAWNSGKRSVVVSGNSATQVAVYATKPGSYKVTATVGTVTDTVDFIVDVPDFAARQVKVSEEKVEMRTETSRLFTAKLTDIYDNVVPFAPVQTVGSGSLNGGAGTNFVFTDAAGIAKQYFSSTKVEGTGLATFDLYSDAEIATAIPGSPAFVGTSRSTVEVSSRGPAPVKTIVIVGERGTVSGKPGILVDGTTTGFDSGAKVKPWVRFPGQSTYTVGTARPTVSGAGDFSWQRKTGKKTYVYFSSEDDAVKSNRVIIPAN